MSPPPKLLDLLQHIPDPRGGQGKDYPLHALLALCLAAILSGRTSLRGITRFGHDRPELLEPLGFKPDKPFSLAPSTLTRTFESLDLEHLNLALRDWFSAWHGQRRTVILDGKHLRGSRDASTGEAATHLLSAYLSQAQQVLGSAKLNPHEASSAPVLLEQLGLESLAGVLLVADAGLLTHKLAGQILAKRGITCSH